MHVHGGDDIVGTECLAIVELHALAQVEGPDLRISGSFPARGKFADQLTFRRHFGQTFEDAAMAHVDHVCIGMCTAVPRVGRVAAGQAEAIGSAVLWRGHRRHARDRQCARGCRRLQCRPP